LAAQLTTRCCDCQAITFDSPRIGSWIRTDSDCLGTVRADGSCAESARRSMDGQISTFRIWSVQTDGKDVCASAPLPGLELGLILSDTGSTVHDVSGNERNGNVHDADWSEDVPPFDGSLCPTYYLLQSQKSDADSGGGGGGTFVLLVVVIALAAGGMYMAFDKGLLKAKGTVAQSMYAQMEEDATAKDKRIAELEKQLEMGGASSPCLLSQACTVRPLLIRVTIVVCGGCRRECRWVRGAHAG